MAVVAEGDKVLALNDDDHNDAGTRDDRRLLQLVAFSPAIAHWELSENPGADGVRDLKPHAWEFDCALLFVDISGFTDLCTRLKIDDLQRHINKYFIMLIDKIVSMGGDILRFAGDAVLCSWSLKKAEPGEEGNLALMHAAQAACRCAIELNSECGTYDIPEIHAMLSIHSGVGVGPANAFRVGTSSRWEFLIAGAQPNNGVLDQIAAAEGCAERGEAVCSPEVWKLVNKTYVGKARGTDGCMLLEGGEEDGEAGKGENGEAIAPLASRAKVRDKGVTNFVLEEALISNQFLRFQRAQQAHPALKRDEHIEPLSAYVHDIARAAIEADVLDFVAEQRSVLTAFCKVDGLEAALLAGKGGLEHVQQSIQAAYDCVVKQGGMLRQFIQDDKGVVMIWTFGLSKSTKSTFEDMAHCALTTCFDVIAALKDLGLSPRCGITSGTAFCGLVGAKYRCEYGVMGPSVNLAARLMCACEKYGVEVLCNDDLYDELVQHHDKSFSFTAFPPVKVKGYSNPIVFYHPIQTQSWRRSSSVPCLCLCPRSKPE